MPSTLNILLCVTLAALVATLGVGIYSLFRGGDFGRSWSNKLMRLRVLLQFTAIVILTTIGWLAQHRH
jgi:Hypoxia induced protein conserved region